MQQPLKKDTPPRFLGGFVKHQQIQNTIPMEGIFYAFVGRSNVGKSSLLNALTQSVMARVSQQPGKTREINFFKYKLAGLGCTFVDLPGYGFAQVSRELKNAWQNEITAWIEDPGYRKLVILLIDGRHGFLAQDQEFVTYLNQKSIEYCVAFTKMDKWKSANQQRQARKKLLDFGNELGVPQMAWVSSKERQGTKELAKLLVDFLKNAQ